MLPEENENDFHKIAQRKLFFIANLLRRHADEIMNKYIGLKEATSVDSSLSTQVAKQIFDDAERDGNHRRLLFKFHDSVYELCSALEHAQFSSQAELDTLLERATDAQDAYEELRKSALYYYKLTQDSIAALQ
jgi:hypothetical protein